MRETKKKSCSSEHLDFPVLELLGAHVVGPKIPDLDTLLGKILPVL